MPLASDTHRWIYGRLAGTGCMNQESVAFGVPLAGIVLGVIVLLLGVPAGGLNPVLVSGGVIALLGVAWLAWNIGSLE